MTGACGAGGASHSQPKDITIVPLLIRSSIGAQPSAGAVSSRVMRDLSGETTGNYQQAISNIYGLIFKGLDNLDWIDPMTAATDNTRCTIISDRNRTIRSGNAAGVNRITKTYIPINKTLVYDDEENGISMTPAAQTVGSKQGMGDMYIVDFFVCGAPVDPVGSSSPLAAQAPPTGTKNNFTESAVWGDPRRCPVGRGSPT